jgi:glycosyltransferase involved in cell wall biosynthesis
MAANNAVLYLDTPANRETARDCGISFHPDERDLATKLEQLIVAPERLRDLRERAKSIALEVYSWESVVDQYERLFAEMRA